VKPHGWRDLDPGVLAKLRKIAAIRENSYTLLRAQYVSLHNQYALQDGTLDDLIVPPTTEAEQFDSRIKSVIWVAHLSIALGSPKKLTARKKIARGAREFADTLQTLSPEDKEILLYFLPHQRQATFDDFITATRELADEARDICIAAERRLRQQAHRFSFVNHLLSAVADGGRSLTLNSRTERGTLVDAIEVLLPYLPQELSEMPSFSTLKRFRKAWVQNSKRKSQKTSL
jgi:hypothetical protein